MSISILDYSCFCLAQSINYIGCGFFWGYLHFFAAFIVFIFWCFLLRKYLQDRREWAAFLKRLADREKVAEPEVMNKHIWHGE